MRLYSIYYDELAGREIAPPEAIYLTLPPSTRIDTTLATAACNRKDGAA